MVNWLITDCELRIADWDRKGRGKRKDAKGANRPSETKGVQIPEKERKKERKSEGEDVSAMFLHQDEVPKVKARRKRGKELTKVEPSYVCLCVFLLWGFFGKPKAPCSRTGFWFLLRNIQLLTANY